MPSPCHKCCRSAQTRCAGCGHDFCMSHLSTTFIDGAAYLLCEACRDDDGGDADAE